MRRLTHIAVCFLLVALASGCTTIYKTAVDERSVSEIASDTRIKLSILHDFGDDEDINVLDFFVGVYEGDVYLVGAYRNAAQKNRAIEIAKKTENVKSVSTYMLPEKKDHPCTTSVNLEITARVKAKLIGDKDIWSTNVDVKTVQCNVVLVGLVGSPAEIKKSIAHANEVENVRKVRSFLKAKK